MAYLQADDIADLITTTQKDLGRMKWTDISYTLQEHIALPQILQKEKVSFQSGQGIQWNVMTTTSGAAKDTSLYSVDSVNVGDVMATASIPWRHMTTNYAIERREIAMNRTPAQIVDLVRIRRHDALVDLAKHLESRLWQKPSSSSDNLQMFGLKYWINWDSSGGTAGGFSGGDPDGYSAGAGGLASSTYDQWQNWCATYSNVTSEDLVRAWRKAATFTNFRPPVQGAEYNTGNQYGYYTNYTVIGKLEEVLEAQNENLGNDIAPKDGRLLFRQTPVTWVPELEGATGDPIYGINWGVMKPAFLAGEYMREEGPSKASNQHTVFQTHIDMTLNLMCTNRRANFVLATADPD
tara:strand:- start:37 stop:1089 length:1053 start_codon:yes stop_codon:yes gene_type:complete